MSQEELTKLSLLVQLFLRNSYACRGKVRFGEFGVGSIADFLFDHVGGSVLSQEKMLEFKVTYVSVNETETENNK